MEDGSDSVVFFELAAMTCHRFELSQPLERTQDLISNNVLDRCNYRRGSGMKGTIMHKLNT